MLRSIGVCFSDFERKDAVGRGISVDGFLTVLDVGRDRRHSEKI